MRLGSFFSLFAIVFLLSSSSPLPSQTVDLKSQFVHVMVYTKDGQRAGLGSGTHIGDGLVLTALHVVNRTGGVRNKPPKPPTMSNLNKDFKYAWESDGAAGEGTVVWIDKDRDVALIQITNANEIKQSKLVCRDPKIREDVSVSAFPMLYGRVEIDGKIIGESKVREDSEFSIPTYLMQLTVLPGMSGGAISVKEGVIGIINAFAMISSTIGAPSFTMGIPGSQLCESMLEYQKSKT